MSSDHVILRRLRNEDLTDGMALPGNLLSRDGQILVPRGSNVDAELIERLLKRSLYIGADWLVSPDEEIQAPTADRTCRRSPSSQSDPRDDNRAQHQQAGKGSDRRVNDTRDRRQQVRKSWIAPLTIELVEPGIVTQPRRLKVLATDISAGGFAFLYKQFIHKDKILIVSFDALPQKSDLRAVVRYCQKVEGLHHRIGVKFLPPEEF